MSQGGGGGEKEMKHTLAFHAEGNKKAFFIHAFSLFPGTPDGTGVRDYIHIMDLADGHTAAVNKILTPEFKGVSAYNLGNFMGYF